MWLCLHHGTFPAFLYSVSASPFLYVLPSPLSSPLLCLSPYLSTFNSDRLFKGGSVVALLKTRRMRAKWSHDWGDIIPSVGAFLSQWIRNRREEWRIASEWVHANSPFRCYVLNPHSQSVFGGTSRAFPMFMRLLNEAEVSFQEDVLLVLTDSNCINTHQAVQLTKGPSRLCHFDDLVVSLQIM